ncbi:MAG: hypothetical protein MZV70_42855 [Desulfobacterales bacterium]|nr:hypothetical protein [Desulfobacterales bacterium]
MRGLIQRILEHPDGFTGEVVIVENGQGRGSLRCDTSSSYGGDTSVRANANDESHSFVYLVDQVFRDRRVSATLLDPDPRHVHRRRRPRHERIPPHPERLLSLLQHRGRTARGAARGRVDGVAARAQPETAERARCSSTTTRADPRSPGP